MKLQVNSESAPLALQPAKAASIDLGRFCPNCGTVMLDSRCKLKCPTCEFFLSCSDFY